MRKISQQTFARADALIFMEPACIAKVFIFAPKFGKGSKSSEDSAIEAEKLSLRVIKSNA